MTTTRNAVAGHNTRLAIATENTFASMSGSPSWFVPGYGAQVTTKEGSHQATKLFQPDSRSPNKFVEEQFEGTLSLEFVLSGPEFLELCIAPGDGGSPETFQGDFPTSATVVIGDEQRDNEDTLKGFVVSDCEISCEVPGEFRVTLDGAFATQETDTTGIGTNGPADQPLPSGEPLTFQEAKYTVNGNVIKVLSNASLSISNNVDMLGDFGTNVAVDYSPKAREVDSSYTKTKQKSPGNDEKNDLYGGATSVKDNDPDRDGLVFEASDGTRSIKFETGPAILDSLSEEGLGDAESDIEMSPERMARSDPANSTPDIKAIASGF